MGPFQLEGFGHVSVHRACAEWAPEVYFSHGAIRKLRSALRRGQTSVGRCAYCGEKGATLGCLVELCPRNYHYACTARPAAGRPAAAASGPQTDCPRAGRGRMRDGPADLAPGLPAAQA